MQAQALYVHLLLYSLLPAAGARSVRQQLVQEHHSRPLTSRLLLE